MKNNLCKDFQETVSQFTIRHKSILDILSKLNEANARTNRATTKAITQCGCIMIDAKKHNWSQEISLQELSDMIDTHKSGYLCNDCKEVLEIEIGRLLFYITALCNTLELDLEEIINKENKKVLTLGKFNLT